MTASSRHPNKLTNKEEVRLTERLRKIESEQAIAWGLHRLSGGFVKAEYDECDEERIYITLTDGIQSDCYIQKNISRLSLWRNTLEWAPTGRWATTGQIKLTPIERSRK